jgi:predicted nucleic-acid-binding Zn-ribbon protein
MIEGTMKCYKCGKRSYDDNACSTTPTTSVM